MIELNRLIVKKETSRFYGLFQGVTCVFRFKVTLLLILTLLMFFSVNSLGCGTVQASGSELYAYITEESTVESEHKNKLAKPYDPYPLNSAGGLLNDVELKWKGIAGDIEGNLHYIIHFGTGEEPGIVGAIWPREDETEFRYAVSALEVDTYYYWKVIVRDDKGLESNSSLWTFNTYGSVSGRATSGEAGLPEKEVMIYRFEGEDNWVVHDQTLTDEEGYYSLTELPSASYLVKLKSDNPRYSDMLVIEGGHIEDINFDIEAYDFELLLNVGWNLISLPRWAEDDGIAFPEPWEDYVESWLSFIDGEWEQGSTGKTLQEVLNNPARAVYINVLQPMVLRFTWKEIYGDLKFASQELYPGWNLISTSYEEDYRVVLAGLADFGGGGITHISVPNAANRLKGFNYSLPWPQPLASMLGPSSEDLTVMYPLDGYWVYLNGDPRMYTIMVSTENPKQRADKF